MLLINRIRSEEVEYSLKFWILLVVFVLLAFSSVIELSVNLCIHRFSWTGYWCRHLVHSNRTVQWKVLIESVGPTALPSLRKPTLCHLHLMAGTLTHRLLLNAPSIAINLICSSHHFDLSRWTDTTCLLTTKFAIPPTQTIWRILLALSVCDPQNMPIVAIIVTVIQTVQTIIVIVIS